ncbi:hypothetical protein HNY73_010737 [Argiope bruennichi]|uniref:Uncharacterized protein n=1 Tax=Argiope bruennichi TaxID=94029 RepID=A0A8T0F4F8_ARGBR|nr:hypothetical protein HNY73_010737 [Argiope bruennichi]
MLQSMTRRQFYRRIHQYVKLMVTVPRAIKVLRMPTKGARAAEYLLPNNAMLCLTYDSLGTELYFQEEGK